METQSIWPEFNTDGNSYFLYRRLAELGSDYTPAGSSGLDEEQGMDLLLGLHLNLADYCRVAGNDSVGLLNRIKSGQVVQLMRALTSAKQSLRLPVLKDLRMSVWAKIVSESSTLQHGYRLAGVQINTEIDNLIELSFPVRSLFGELMLYRWSGDVKLTSSARDELHSYISTSSVFPPGQ